MSFSSWIIYYIIQTNSFVGSIFGEKVIKGMRKLLKNILIK